MPDTPVHCHGTPDMVYFQGEFEANVCHIPCQDFGSLIYISLVILSGSLS